MDNIKMYFQQVLWGVEWIDETQNRDRWRILVNMVMSLGVVLLEKPRDC